MAIASDNAKDVSRWWTDRAISLSHTMRRLPGGKTTVDRIRKWRLERLASRTPRSLSRYDLDQLIGLSLNHTIADGPFAGMRYLRHATGSVLAAKLLGSYEFELRPWISEAIDTPYRSIVDVGCAEGYYAVGLARAMPRVLVHACDVDGQARDWTRQLAQLNGVESRVNVHGELTTGQLNQWATPETLIVCDIEGGELQLLDPSHAPALTDCDVVVEVHDVAPSTTVRDQLLHRFRHSHVIDQAAHEPRCEHRFRIPTKLRDPGLRSFAVAEGRSRGTRWLRMLSRSSALREAQ